MYIELAAITLLLTSGIVTALPRSAVGVGEGERESMCVSEISTTFITATTNLATNRPKGTDALVPRRPRFAVPD